MAPESQRRRRRALEAVGVGAGVGASVSVFVGVGVGACVGVPEGPECGARIHTAQEAQQPRA